MRRRLYPAALVLLGLTAYGIALIAKMPAALALPWALADSPLQVYDPSGTVWQGHAAAVVRRSARLEAVDWQLDPFSLLTLSPAAHVRAELPNGRIASDIEAELGGKLTLRELRLDADLDSLLALAGKQAFSGLATGRIAVIAPEIALRNGRPLRADGLVTWEDAGVGPGGQIPLGDLALRVTTAADGGLRGALSSKNAPLRLTGELNLGNDGVLSGELVFEPRSRGDPKAARVARKLGLANPNGRNVVDIRREPGKGFSVQQR